MTAECRFDRLAVAVAFHSGELLEEPPTPCPEPAAFYVSIVQGDDDYVIEHLTHLCGEHDTQARLARGYQWSRKRRERQAA